jgi:hypothetical protein
VPHSDPVATSSRQFAIGRSTTAFQARDIGFSFYNGGGDSQDTAHKVSLIGPSSPTRSFASGSPKQSTIICRSPTVHRGSARQRNTLPPRSGAAFHVASVARTSTKVSGLDNRRACALAAEAEGGGHTSWCCPKPRSMRSDSWPRSRTLRRGTATASSPCRKVSSYQTVMEKDTALGRCANSLLSLYEDRDAGASPKQRSSRS